ncbi:hypothetical protein AGMMS49944_01980 [Spirochaetia bacterium]|nr:hypothetical protein AGMMS49944_01980 [Spirochaetia bacterium]
MFDLRNGMKGFVLCTVAIVLAVGCASGPKAEQKTILLDDKGAALGIPTPAWVSHKPRLTSNLARSLRYESNTGTPQEKDALLYSKRNSVNIGIFIFYALYWRLGNPSWLF